MIDLLLVTFFQLAAGAPADAQSPPSAEDWYQDASGETDDDADAAPANAATPAAPSVSGVTVTANPEQRCTERATTGHRIAGTVCEDVAGDEARRENALLALDDLRRLRDALEIERLKTNGP